MVAESGGAGGILGRRCITKSYYTLFEKYFAICEVSLISKLLISYIHLGFKLCTLMLEDGQG